MKTTITIVFALSMMSFKLATAQEEKDKKIDFADLYQRNVQLQWIDLDAMELWTNNEFVAADGNYVAQNYEELQTYNDLGLKYQYIELEEFRSQMRLPKGEGIMIKAAPSKSKGYQLGFRKGDIVLRVAEQPVDDQYKFVTAITGTRGKSAIVKLRRAGTDNRLTFTLPNVKKEPTANWVLGVQVDPISKTLKKHLRTEGVIIRSVVKDSPANKMGLQIDDVIVAIDDAKTSSLSDLQQQLKNSKGAKIEVHLIREGNKVSVEIIPMKQEKATKVETEIPYLKWNYTKPAKDFTLYSKYDFDMDGAEDFVLVPTAEREQNHDSMLQRLDELSKKIDQLTKQVDQLNTKK